LEKFNQVGFDEYILVVSENDYDIVTEYIENTSYNVKIVLGGQSRCESVRNAIKHASGDYVFIHDAARPLIHIDDIKNRADIVIKDPFDGFGFDSGSGVDQALFLSLLHLLRRQAAQFSLFFFHSNPLDLKILNNYKNIAYSQAVQRKNGIRLPISFLITQKACLFYYKRK
jgi:hypothetical protein